VVSGAASPDRWETAVSAIPDRVQTLPDLATAFNTLRGALSYTDLEKAARALPVRNGRRPALPRSTVSNLMQGRSVSSRDTVITFLAACGLDADAQAPWLAAWERASTTHLRRPAAVRVREARPRLLGVHASIQVAAAAADLPSYVPRDFDADVRAAITAASDEGGFVLLVGGSSVGKTRALFEAVRAVLPEWWLIHPDPADTDAVRTLAGGPTPRTVVWLDELQRYLNIPDGLSPGLARRLITAGTVLVATLWPHEYHSRTSARVSGQPDPHANDRELLRLAHVIDVSDNFSAAELRRAETLATDQRIRTALDTPDAGFTQVLAAGPELVRWWENAPDEQCYGKAVITAALDARRVGAHAPLSRDLLAAAAPAYLTSTQQAVAPADWLDRALTYALTPLNGATATLCQVAAGMGHIAGYTVADYLYQHARRVRRSTPLPDVAWRALVEHHRPDDTLTLAEGAIRRMRPEYAETIYRRAAEAGDMRAAYRLADRLAKQGHIDEARTLLRQCADAGDDFADFELADLLAAQGRIDELRQLADAGGGRATVLVADLFVGQGRLDEAYAILRKRAGAGEDQTAIRLLDLLVEHDHVGELRQRADAGDTYAANRLVNLFADQGRIDELRQRADSGNTYAGSRLAGILIEQGHIDEAGTILRRCADAGDDGAALRLVDLLVEQGHIDELRQRADAEIAHVAYRLGDILGGIGYAASRLAAMLVEQGHIDELRQRADGGDVHAIDKLTDLLVEQGHIDEASTILRQRSDAGDEDMAYRLVHLLADHGHINELQAEVHAGTPSAAETLANLRVPADLQGNAWSPAPARKP
jgi:hypothetical protein